MRSAILTGFYSVLGWLLFAVVAHADSSGIYDLPYQFTDDKEQPFQFASWRGGTNIVTFAYAECRKVCAETLHVLERLQADADSAQTSVNFFVVSYDPINDTPQVWETYRAQHNLTRANWHFLTGSVESVHALAARLDFKYWLYDEHVMHDFRILLLDAGGNPQQVMDWRHRDEHWFH